ncbi:DUF1116 domain-containing protein [Leekyejoonella antrihumi]|uniref:DUF1116 domain-containing protein n=1 Tax=Leekyejoonella antrihumi TaxID=1660198 RepID=A0A563E750_9MICO|nr:DUF1116 domain-containing protein [Leekyejoonella antrihumi]TWP38041.1 DUF1116 domain-containing protein [Leekyejoonella antrihumi]
MTIHIPDDLSVVNIGLPLFAEAIAQQGRPVQQLDWRIPAGGDPAAVAALAELFGPRSRDIDRANAEVVRRLDEGAPILTRVAPARDVIDGLPDRTLLHCGPAIAFEEVCDPLRRSMRAAAVAEGWAADPVEADRLIADGSLALCPAGDYGVVVPMATAMGPATPVFVVDNEAGGTRAFSPVNQGPGDTAWFGRDSDGAIARLRFLQGVGGSMLRDVMRAAGPIDVMALATQGVQIGDDVHMRTQGTTNLLIRNLLPHLAALPDAGRVELARFLSGNHLFFLNLAMAAARSLTMWAEQVSGSSVVTTMCRNGTTFGLRLAGNDTLFVTEAPPILDAMYYPDYGPETSAPDIGDSAVLELVGLGGAAAAGSPAVAGFLGGRMSDARAVTEDMAQTCVTHSSRFTLPTWDYQGTPLGVDARYVVELGLPPRITTGILHTSSGAGQIGAGVATAPIACFRDAVLALAAEDPRTPVTPSS